MAASAPRRPAFISSVIYQDSRAALSWLRDTFGFEVSEVLTDSKGNIAHAEMTHGDGVVMIASEWTDWSKSPASIGGKNTQRIHVRLEKDIDKHCEHARQAGCVHPDDAGGSVLRRPHVQCARSGRSLLDLLASREKRVARRHGKGKRPEVSTAVRERS